MSKKNKIILCSSLLVLGLLMFILQIFVFEYPDGIFGFILCLISIYLMLGSIIKLLQLSENFKNNFLAILDLFFWIN